MLISQNKVVTIHYSVRTPNGDLIDESRGSDPLAFIQGTNFMIAGLEEALEGRQTGDKFEVTIEPDKAYGERHEQLVQQVPVAMFEGMDVEVGMSFRATTDNGEQSVTIIDKTDEFVTVDGNHPLSGQTLVFDVDVVEVRDATQEEMSHGHVHGPGGCNH